MSNWSELPEDILSSVCKRIKIAVDYVQFRAVCKSWRSVAKYDYNLLLPQPPFLMLAEEDELEVKNNVSPSDLRRGFVGISQPDKVYYIELPEAHQKNCIGSTGNWLITVGIDNIQLLDPFSRVEIPLPNQFTFKDPPQFLNGDDSEEEDEDYIEYTRIHACRNAFINRVILSSHNPRDCIVIVLYSYSKLAFARPGDTSWITIDSATRYRPFDNLIFFNNRFYAINYRGMVFLCDTDTLDVTPVLDTPIRKKDNTCENFYLVEWLGELLVVFRSVKDFGENVRDDDDSSFNEENPVYKTRYFTVFKLDLDTKDKQVVNNLGQHSLFLGRNTSVSVLASPSSELKKNCIYFTDDVARGFLGTDTKGGHDMGIFDLEEQIIRPHYPHFSTSIYSPPIWVIPKSIMKNTSNIETNGTMPECCSM